MRKVCTQCLTIIRPHEFERHRGTCGGKLITIDDQICDIITKIWKVGIHTEFSCIGHFESNVFSPYIVFVDLDPTVAENIMHIVKRMADDTFLELNKTKNNQDRAKFDITLYAIPPSGEKQQLSLADKIDYQTRFLMVLYSILEYSK